jgi:hypothetical protein
VCILGVQAKRLSLGEETMTQETINSPSFVFGEIDAKPEQDDLRFYSVTTILKCLDKPALLYWAAEEAAKCAVNVRGSLTRRIKEEGEDAVVKWIKLAMYRPQPGKVTAAALGTAVHDAVEQYAYSGVRPAVENPEVEPFLDRFDEWAQKWQPVYEAAEAAVYNKTYGYAGTLDAIAVIDGQRVLLDYKSSRKSVGSDDKPTHPYPEVALQLAAYSHAELMAVWRARRFEKYRRRYYLLNTDEEELGQPLGKIDGAVCLHLTPQHADLYPVRADDAVFEKFLYCIEVFDWQNGLAKNAVGSPLVKRGE